MSDRQAAIAEILASLRTLRERYPAVVRAQWEESLANYPPEAQALITAADKDGHYVLGLTDGSDAALGLVIELLEATLSQQPKPEPPGGQIFEMPDPYRKGERA